MIKIEVRSPSTARWRRSSRTCPTSGTVPSTSRASERRIRPPRDRWASGQHSPPPAIPASTGDQQGHRGRALTPVCLEGDLWRARDDNVGFRAVWPQHQSHVCAGGRRFWPAEASGAVMEGLANGRVDNDLGALKELLAITRTATSTAKTW